MPEINLRFVLLIIMTLNSFKCLRGSSFWDFFHRFRNLAGGNLNFQEMCGINYTMMVVNFVNKIICFQSFMFLVIVSVYSL